MKPKTVFRVSDPAELEGMNWLPEPDPHVRVFDILQSDERERRWLTGFIPRGDPTIDHLRTSLLDCFPFSGRGMRPKTSTKKLWDRRLVEITFDSAASASASLPLIQSLGSFSVGASGTSSKSLIFELTDVSIAIAEKLVLLDEHLQDTAPVHMSREFYDTLTSGRIYVVIAAYRAGAIGIHDSAAFAAGTKLSHESVLTDVQVVASSEVARSATVLFERRAAGESAAFGIKVRQIGFDGVREQFFLGPVRAARVRGTAKQR